MTYMKELQHNTVVIIRIAEGNYRVIHMDRPIIDYVDSGDDGWG